MILKEPDVMHRAISLGFKTTTRRRLVPQPPEGAHLLSYDGSVAVFCHGKGKGDGASEATSKKVDRGSYCLKGSMFTNPYGQRGSQIFSTRTGISIGVKFALEVLGVTVERLHDITEEGAAGEGFHLPDRSREEFARHWDLSNGTAGPWLANPWVWVISFRRTI